VGTVALTTECLVNTAAASPRAVNTIPAYVNGLIRSGATRGIPLPHLPAGYSRNPALPPMAIKPRHITTQFRSH